MGFFDDDICWCGNSNKLDMDYCDKVYCFRHFSRRRPQSQPDIYTMAFFKDTEDCPYYKGENDVR